MSVVVVGLSHRSIGLDVLEAAAVPADALPKALHDLRHREHIGEVAVLSTCMRTEIYATTSRFHGAAGDIRNFLAAWSGLPPEAMADGVYDFYADVAVEHLFRVAAGLESAVLGESEILRQVRGAGEAARDEGTFGPVLDGVFRRASETGKRVRSETAIARGTTSLSHTAVMLAGEHLAALRPAADSDPCPGASTLAGRRALVVGAGEMGSAVASLFAAGPEVAGVLVANRTPARAAELATAVGGTAVPWSRLADAVAEVDVVFCTTGATEAVLTVDTVGPRGEDRPLVVVDLGLPRNADPAVGELAGVSLFGMDALKGRAEAAMAGRRAEIPRAEAIVASEVARWAGAAAAREVAPLITDLRDRAETIRAAELAKIERRLAELPPSDRRAVEAMTRAIIAKLLHEPTVNLKAAAGDDRGEQLAGALAELFDL